MPDIKPGNTDQSDYYTPYTDDCGNILVSPIDSVTVRSYSHVKLKFVFPAFSVLSLGFSFNFPLIKLLLGVVES